MFAIANSTPIIAWAKFGLKVKIWTKFRTKSKIATPSDFRNHPGPLVTKN